MRTTKELLIMLRDTFKSLNGRRSGLCSAINLMYFDEDKIYVLFKKYQVFFKYSDKGI